MKPNELGVEPDKNEDEAALQQALGKQVPAGKLVRLTQSHPPPPSWFQEEFNRPPATDALD